jgi:ribonuclease G
MESKQNRERVLQELRTHLARDRARTKAFQVSELGLIEMTRQRVRQSLYQSQTESCPCCSGTGRIFTPETIVRRIERAVRRAATDGKERSLVARVHPEVALYALENERDFTKRLDRETKVRVTLRDDPLLQQDEYKIVSGSSSQDLTQKYALG